MSSATKPAKKTSVPRPSASILLISPTNEILLLHRVQTSSSFPSAHVFPGGNLSAEQDGQIPGSQDSKRHEDGEVYRIGAIRECFEESGILLAKRGDGSGQLLELPDEVREKGRKDIHGGKVRFQDWVKAHGGVLDTGALLPFTRWITPTSVPKRFTTQMYIYFLPLSQATAANIKSEAVIPTPTSDGGLEHTTAQFATSESWLQRATRGDIILFPPQFFLMHLLASFLKTKSLQEQRNDVLRFLQGDGGDGSGIVWGDKVISPTSLLMRKSDGMSVLGLDKPGPELKGSGRGGDARRVVLVKFNKGGPRLVAVRERKEVLEEERNEKL